jgi:dolichol-phosphate mannosyltransferase
MPQMDENCGWNALVIVPTYNESENLPVLVSRVMELPGFRLLIVDDQSPDGTGAIADNLAARYPPGRVTVLHRQGERGLGNSYVDGFAAALQTNAEFICQMDADLSHDPTYLPDLVSAASEFDLVIGSRYVCGVSVVNWPLRRILLSTMANQYIRAVTRLRVRDCTSGFRCWRRSALEHLRLDATRSNGYAFMVETLFRAAQQNCRVSEVPIIFVERRAGASKVSMRVVRESLLMPWRLVLKALPEHDRPAGRRRGWPKPAAMREPEPFTVALTAGVVPRIEERTLLRYK